MALEQVFTCSLTLSKLRNHPLGELMDGFYDALREDGFSRSTIRRYLSNVAHLNAYLGARKTIDGQALCAQAVNDFLGTTRRGLVIVDRRTSTLPVSRPQSIGGPSPIPSLIKRGRDRVIN